MAKSHFRKLWGDDYKRFIGDKFMGKDVSDGVIYYKPQYAFLHDAWHWDRWNVKITSGARCQKK